MKLLFFMLLLFWSPVYISAQTCNQVITATIPAQRASRFFSRCHHPETSGRRLLCGADDLNLTYCCPIFGRTAHLTRTARASAAARAPSPPIGVQIIRASTPTPTTPWPAPAASLFRPTRCSWGLPRIRLPPRAKTRPPRTYLHRAAVLESSSVPRCCIRLMVPPYTI